MNTNTYRVDTLGNYQEIAKEFEYGFSELFEQDGYLFGIEQAEAQLFYSNNEGISWQGINLFLTDRFKSSKLTDSTSVFYWNDNLFLFTLNFPNYRIEPLQNKGLEGNIITGVSKYGRRVFVSTLGGGLYVRPFGNLRDTF